VANVAAGIEELLRRGYGAGWVTEIDQETIPPGLNETTVRLISEKKQEPRWLLEWRLKALHAWQRMSPPGWAKVHHAPIDFQAISYFAAPKRSVDAPRSLDDVDPALL